MGGTKRNVDMSATEQEIKIVEVEPTQADAAEAPTEQKKVKKVAAKVRGKKYRSVRAKIDRSKKYDLLAAVELVKKLSYSTFDGTVEAALVVKDIGTSVSLSLPHSTGKTVKVAIMSNDLLKEIEAGNIDFDVLVSSPEFMPKLAKHARVLGPKGLMPNPKSGTLTTNPELKKKELEAGSFLLKKEKKAPLMHLPVGKVSMDSKEIMENIQAILKALKGKIVKLSISASMSPGVKVEIEK